MTRERAGGGMVAVPGGPFEMGTTPERAASLAAEHGYHPSWFEGETPRRTVELAAFEIDRTPVTEADYAAFCDATDRDPPSHWRDGRPPTDRREHPVVNVDRADAAAYAAWADKRLPTEAEWERAARGTDGRLFPWGDAFDPERCCWGGDQRGDGYATAPVTAHPGGESPCGALDMAGNVAEWCSDAPGGAAGDDAAPGPGPAAIKGGAWLTSSVPNLRPAARNMSGFSNNAHEYYGFRCARDR